MKKYIQYYIQKRGADTKCSSFCISGKIVYKKVYKFI